MRRRSLYPYYMHAAIDIAYHRHAHLPFNKMAEDLALFSSLFQGAFPGECSHLLGEIIVIIM